MSNSSSYRRGIEVLFCSVLGLLWFHPIQADITRDHAMFMDMPIAGITLSMTPRQAFTRLQQAGYRASKADSFDAWRTGSIELVRAANVSGGGESYVFLSRQYPDRLINISETAKPATGEFDLHAEINRMRQYFGISEDERDCEVNDKSRVGVCGIIDGNQQKPFAALIIVRSNTREIQLGYAQESPRGPDDPQP